MTVRKSPGRKREPLLYKACHRSELDLPSSSYTSVMPLPVKINAEVPSVHILLLERTTGKTLSNPISQEKSTSEPNKDGKKEDYW